METFSRGRLGRARLAVLADASEVCLGAFLVDCVVPGSTVVTDAWPGYWKRATKPCVHEKILAGMRQSH